MLLPLGLYKENYIVVGEMDWQFNVTQKCVVENEKVVLEDVMNGITDPLEQLCFKSELQHITANKIRAGRRLLCLIGCSDRLSGSTLAIKNDGIRVSIEDGLRQSRFANTADPEFSMLDAMCGWHPEIKYLEKMSRIVDNDGVAETTGGFKLKKLLSSGEVGLSFSDGTSQKVSHNALEYAKWYILIDKDTKYPMLLTESNNRLYRLPIVYSTTTYCYHDPYINDKAVLQQAKEDLHMIRRRLEYDGVRPKVLYPLLDCGNIEELLYALTRIKPALVAPFYVAYKAWLAQDGGARQIKVGDKAFWTAVEDDSGFGDALSIYGLSTERSIVYRDDKLYEVNTHTTDFSKLIQECDGDLYYKRMGIRGRVLVNLTGLMLMNNSLCSLNTGLLYYINELKGAERNWVTKQQFLDDRLELYISPNNSNSILIHLIEDLWVDRPVILTFSHAEWYKKGKREQLSELLAQLCLDAQDMTRVIDVKLRFIDGELRASKDLEIVEVMDLFVIGLDSITAHPNGTAIRLTLGSDDRGLEDSASTNLTKERQTASQIHKDILRGMLKLLGIVRGQEQNVCHVQAESVRLRKAMENNYTKISRSGIVYGCYDCTHFQFEVNGTVNSPVINARYISDYMGLQGSRGYAGIPLFQDLQSLCSACNLISKDMPVIGIEKDIVAQLKEGETEIYFMDYTDNPLILRFKKYLEKLWRMLDM